MRRALSTLVLFGIILSSSACRSAVETETVTQLSIWSSTSPEADSPRAAAEAAVRDLIGVTPVLGDYMAGDGRSGEMIVFSPAETVPVERSLLLLRQLGSDDRWSVIGAISAAIAIDEPASGSTVPAGPVTVAGSARGFEGLVVVSGHRVGTNEMIDQQITSGGSLDKSEPFRVEIDLRDTQEGDVIAIVVRGGVGLEDDPGEFSALPIRIGS